MAREFSRTNRISEVMMRELALLIQHDLSDPRVSMVTVSHVDVTPDLKYARVYVTRLSGFDSEEAAKECLAGLNNAAAFYAVPWQNALSCASCLNYNFAMTPP